MPWILVCMTKMSYNIFLSYMCFRDNVTEEVQGLMCASEFMFQLSVGLNVSEWLEAKSQRLNPDGCASTGYLWTGTTLRCENALTAWNITLIPKTTNCTWMSFYDVIMKITLGFSDTICDESRSTLVVAYSGGCRGRARLCLSDHLSSSPSSQRAGSLNSREKERESTALVFTFSSCGWWLVVENQWIYVCSFKSGW